MPSRLSGWATTATIRRNTKFAPRPLPNWPWGADGDDKDDEPDVYPANHATKAGEVIPVDPIDYEDGDEIDFQITVTDMDGDGESDGPVPLDRCRECTG